MLQKQKNVTHQSHNIFIHDQNELRDAVDQARVLAGTFQISGNKLKAQSIRKAEKSLVALESFFDSQLIEESRTWKRSVDALDILNEIMNKTKEKRDEIEHVQLQLKKLQESMRQWMAISEAERLRILYQAKAAEQYINNHVHVREAHILHRYERYDSLKPLLAFADNANHLCDAINHFENRKKYEDNLLRLTARQESAIERRKAVKRGFVLALVLCLFVVTLPLCVPFAFSLWNRMREIDIQISNAQESMRRETKRLQAADEGVVANDTIREYLGDISLDQIRNTLEELKELRYEFGGPEKNTSATSSLLSFIDLYRVRLQDMFGEIPIDPVESFVWFESKMSKIQNIECRVAALTAELEVHESHLRRLTKGHSVQILENSISNLKDLSLTNMRINLPPDSKQEFAKICIQSINLLKDARNGLGLVTHGQRIDEQWWSQLQTRVASMSQSLSLCLAEWEFSQMISIYSSEANYPSSAAAT